VRDVPLNESPPTLVVVGPPGSGVQLVVAALVRAGVKASGWEGGAQPPPPTLPGEPGPLVVALEAHDLTCLGRLEPPWSERELPVEMGAAGRELELSRQRLFPWLLRAQLVLDTSQLSAFLVVARVHQLLPYLQPDPAAQPAVVLESFAYPRGVPLDLGWCLDARALRNPYWEPGLRMVSGLDPRVREFVLSQPLALALVDGAVSLSRHLLPELVARSRRVLRVGFGCTGGFHRSVALAEAVGGQLRAAGVDNLIWHRDLSERA